LPLLTIRKKQPRYLREDFPSTSLQPYK